MAFLYYSNAEVRMPGIVPKTNGVKETCLHVEDLARARTFYENVMGFSAVVADEHFCAYDAGGESMLLLFVRGLSAQPKIIPGGVIPPHDGGGRLHVGFAVSRDQLAEWDAHLRAHGVAIESTVDWPRGGRSLYFRDPDGHLLEVLTPGVWAIY
jgi:catechol 2,3-dioxygenase-like lactoylglutathione lyase family enzyme